MKQKYHDLNQIINFINKINKIVRLCTNWIIWETVLILIRVINEDIIFL